MLLSTQSSLKIVQLKIATSHFTHLLQLKRKETRVSMNILTLDFFFLKDYNDEWNDLTKKFSSFVDDAASTLASSIKYVETGGSSSEHGGPRDGDPSRHTTSLTRKRRLAGGLVVSDMLLGDGAPVKPGRRISLHYTGSL